MTIRRYYANDSMGFRGGPPRRRIVDERVCYRTDRSLYSKKGQFMIHHIARRRLTAFLSIGFLVFALTGCYTNDPHAGGDDLRRGDLWSRYADAPLPEGAVRVNIERLETEATDRSVIEAALRYRDEDVRVDVGRLGGRNGLRVIAVRGDFTAAIRIDKSSTRRRNTQETFIVLMPGADASLQLLETRPEPWLVVFPVWGGVAQGVTFRERVTGTGLFVRVRSATESAVDVELTPYFNRARDGRAIKITELRTRVTLRPGVPYVVAADRTADNSVAQGLLYRRSEDRTTESIQVLTVEVGEGV